MTNDEVPNGEAPGARHFGRPSSNLRIEALRKAIMVSLGDGAVKNVFVCVLLGVGLAPVAFGEKFIVRNGQPRAEIVIAQQPPRMVKRAARELQTYVARISGAQLPIVTEPAEGFPVKVYIGRSPHTDRLGITGEGLRHGAFVMKSGPDWLALVGRDRDFVPPEPW